MWRPVRKKKELPDHCVLCGKETEYTQSTPITARQGYIEGAGQLCIDCLHALYRKAEGKNG